MKWKLQDAKKEFNRQRYENTVLWRETKKILQREGIVDQYQSIWSYEKDKITSSEKVRITKKVAFLRGKYKTGSETTADVGNVVISGVIIDEIPTSNIYESNPRIYGGCNVDNCEKQLLALPAKFAIYESVSMIRVETQVEKSIAKLRWDLMNLSRENNERGTQREQVGGVSNDTTCVNQQDTQMNRDNYYDITDKRFDFRVMRATDLPFNKSVKLPAAVEEEEEVAMQDLKNRLLNVALSYTKENKVPKDNLTESEREGIDSIERRVKTGETIVFQTDKSGRFSVERQRVIRTYRMMLWSL